MTNEPAKVTCAQCGRGVFKFQAKGLCNSCYLKQWRAKNRDTYIPKKRAYQRRKYHENRIDHRNRCKTWWEKNPLKRRNYTLKHTYGTAIDQHRAEHPDLFDRPHPTAVHGPYIEWYHILLDHQQGRCGVPGCGNLVSEWSKGTKSLAIDHCHRTGKIRGLLCHGCNMALGNLRENPGRIAGLLVYLRSHTEAA